MAKIHVIGNSHVWYFTEEEKNSNIWLNSKDGVISAYKCGGTGSTIHGLSNVNSSTQTGEFIKKFVKENKPENLMLVLGDVDIRTHLARHIKETVVEYIDNLLVHKYIKFINEEVVLYCKNIILFALILPSFQCLRAYEIYDVKNGYVQFAFNYFNLKLEELCKENGFHFLNINKYFIDENGFLKPEYLMSNGPEEIHLDLKLAYSYLRPEIDKLLLEFNKEKEIEC